MASSFRVKTTFQEGTLHPAEGCSGAGSEVEVLARGEDGDSSEWMKAEEVVVSGEKEGCATGQSEREELVVFRVPADGDRRYVADVHCDATETVEEAEAVGEWEISVELGTREDGAEFDEGFG
jgi:hypothetical protein